MSVVVTDLKDVAFPEEQRLLLHSVDWETYQTISNALAGRHVRLTFDRGNLEFMTISPLHARYSRLLGRMIVVLTEVFELPVCSVGDMTCSREDLERGLEGDESFYIANAPVIRNKADLDFTVDPPPDLGVEIDMSRSSRSRMPIYAALRVPEVWRFDGVTLTVFQLTEDGDYVAGAQSAYFPGVPVAGIVDFLRRLTEVEENKLLELFRVWVRQQKENRDPPPA